MNRIDALAQEPDPTKVARLTGLIDKVVDDLDAGRECLTMICEINRVAGRSWSSQHFFELYSHTDSAVFARRAAMGPPPRLDNWTRVELVCVLEKIMDPNSSGEMERAEFWVELLDVNFSKTWSSDLVFWPDVERSIDELADHILRDG